MNQPMEVYQPMPDNLIRIHTEGDDKRLEVLAGYKDERHFTVRLIGSEANWLASELKSPHDVNWKRLGNSQVLRVLRSGEVRQLVLSDIRGGQEVTAERIGVVLDEVLGKVIEALRA